MFLEKIIFNVRISTGDNRWYIKTGNDISLYRRGNTLISESTTTEYKVYELLLR